MIKTDANMDLNLKTITSEIPYFSQRELACKGTGVIRLDARFAKALVALRREWNSPLIPNSVCRTPEHNKNEKGHPTSLHLTENPVRKTNGTMAIDIRWRDWSRQKKIDFCRFARKLGWSVGLHEGFVHLDRRVDVGLPQAIFLYGKWNNEFKTIDIL